MTGRSCNTVVRAALQTVWLAVFLACCARPTDARLAGECAMQCNDLRLEVLTLEICRDAKKTLPKPKVGDFCSIAMEQGFSDACVALCMDEKPVARLAQSCRSAAVEMPRPTVRRWCEHGYRTAFDKTINDLREHFKPDGVADQRQKVVQERADAAEAKRQADIKARTEQAAAAKDARDAAAAAAAAARVASEAAPAAAKEASGAGKAAKASEKEAAAAEGAASGARKTLETTAAKVVEDKAAAAAATPAAPAGTEATGTERVVHATITITVDDNNETQLVVYEGQTAEEAVVEYCQTNAADDTAGCIRQLLPVVIEKLGE